MITEDTPRKGTLVGRLLGWLVSLGFLPVTLVGVAYFRDGRAIAEKTATELAMPLTALCWICLIFGLRSLVKGQIQAAMIGLFVSATLFVAASPILSQSMYRQIEATYPAIDSETVEPFDVVIVLGGGTSKAPNGRSQFAEAGDRVGLAARLYHAKRVKQLVVTGDVLPGTAVDIARDPSVQSKRLLLELGVDEADIEEIEGSNTSEEMAALKKRPELWDGKRCGLITSGFHMPRAMRLAGKVGVQVIPVVADYRGGEMPATIRDWLPTAAALRGNDLVFREYLAQFVGR